MDNYIDTIDTWKNLLKNKNLTPTFIEFVESRIKELQPKPSKIKKALDKEIADEKESR